MEEGPVQVPGRPWRAGLRPLQHSTRGEQLTQASDWGAPEGSQPEVDSYLGKRVAASAHHLWRRKGPVLQELSDPATPTPVHM